MVIGGKSHLPLAYLCEKSSGMGRLGGSVVEHLPSAQGVILESQDQVPTSGSPRSLLLPLLMSLPLSLMNK